MLLGVWGLPGFFQSWFQESSVYKCLMEGPTLKCITKLGHCVSVISSQNGHRFYNFSPKHNYFLSLACARGPEMFSMLVPTLASFLHVNNMEAEEQLEMKAKKQRLLEIIQVAGIHKTL